MDLSQTSTAADGDIVSFDNEALIIVDAQDRILGHGTKAELHQGAGTLHRAFSIFCLTTRATCYCNSAAPTNHSGLDIGQTPVVAIHAGASLMALRRDDA